MSPNGGSAASPNTEDLALSDIFGVLLRHRVLLVAITLFCFLIGIFLATRPRKYAADSMLRVQPGASEQYRASPVSSAVPEVADQISPYVEILQSRTLFLRVARELNLANDPAFAGGPVLGRRSLDDPMVRETTLRSMHGQITVTHKPKDEIIRLTAATTSPLLSAKIVNTLINDYVDDLVQLRYGASKRASAFLVKQLDDLKGQVERDQAALTELQSKLGIVGGTSDQTSDYLSAQSLNALTKAASDATVDRILAEAKYRFLQDADPGLIEGEVNLLNTGGNNSSSGNLLQSLRNAQATQSSNYARLLAQFGPNFPEVRQQKSQLDETTRQVQAEEARILNQARLSYSAASANEKMTEKALANKQGQAFHSRGDMVKYAILLHDYESHRTLYEQLISRLQEAGITAGLEGGEVDIIDLADVPALPAPPGKLTFLLGSLLVGLVLGAIAALLAEAVSTSIVTQDQARRAAPALPVLAILPKIATSDSMGSTRDSPYMEAVETLRSALLGEAQESGTAPKVLLVTSATSGEGKSTLAAHLAQVLAQHTARTLLIDCDLRRADLAQRVGLRSEIGLSNVLTGTTSLEKALQPVPSVPGLDFLTSGPSPSTRKAMLLGSTAMSDLIKLARGRYDFIVLNCSPVLGLSDVLNLGRLADAVLLVVRSRTATRGAIRRSLQILSEAKLPVLGTVLTAMPSEVPDNGYSMRQRSRLWRTKEAA